MTMIYSSNKIAVLGMGYVGCGNALMLAKHHEVVIIDIDQNKVNNFNAGKLPIDDKYAQKYFDKEDLDISASTNLNDSIPSCSYAILALPTNFDDKKKQYDTQILDNVVSQILSINKKIIIVIKSTVDIGYTTHLSEKLNTDRIIFSPEFLREGHALEDNLYPSRIIIGSSNKKAKDFLNIMLNACNDKNTQTIISKTEEAESIKLFSNTYLAMRVAFFNELDTFCFDNQINTKTVIEGVSMDKRIGNFYNNPSFGFGGLCLPKDSMQLLERFKGSPRSIIKAIQASNQERASFLSNKIIDLKPKLIGIYKLAMKKDSDNSRDSSVYKIINQLVDKKIKVIIFDDAISELDLKGATLEKNFRKFATRSDLIIANRLDSKIKPFSQKLFTRDIFLSDE